MKKSLLVIFLICASIILGAYSYSLVISLIFLNSKSLEDAKLGVISILQLAIIFVGYGSFLYWLRKFNLHFIIIINILIFIVSFFMVPYYPKLIDDIDNYAHPLPSIEKRYEIYNELSKNLEKLKIPYELDIKSSESLTLENKKSVAIILRKTIKGAVTQEEYKQMLSISPEYKLRLEFFDNAGGHYGGFSFDEKHQIIICGPEYLCNFEYK